MTTRTTVTTVQAYAQALIPHLEHQGYRCDRPRDRLMGKGCRVCGIETLIAIADFQRSGDLAAFEAELKPFVKKGKK